MEMFAMMFLMRTSSHPDTNKHRSALPERAGHFSDLEIIHEKE